MQVRRRHGYTRRHRHGVALFVWFCSGDGSVGLAFWVVVFSATLSVCWMLRAGVASNRFGSTTRLEIGCLISAELERKIS